MQKKAPKPATQSSDKPATKARKSRKSAEATATQKTSVKTSPQTDSQSVADALPEHKGPVPAKRRRRQPSADKV